MEQPDLESPESGRKWMMDSAEGSQDTQTGSEDEGTKASYESSYDCGAGLQDAGRAFSDDSSYYDDCLSGAKGPDVDGRCIKNGKLYEDPLDFVFD